MSKSALRARVESGSTYDDPSKDLLLSLLTAIENGEEDFLVVERTSDRSGQTYAQTALADDRRYVLEYRDGGPERHFQTYARDKHVVHRVITGWAFGFPGWRDTLAWHRWSPDDDAPEDDE